MDDDGLGVYGVKIESCYFNGAIPSSWIVRKDIPHWHTNEADVDQRLKKQRVEHANIRKIFAVVRSRDKTHVFMEYGEQGLDEYMEADQSAGTSLDSKLVEFQRLLGLADAVKFLHDEAADPETLVQEPIRHGDIKAANVVVFKDDAGDTLWKLSDFGISCIGQSTGRGASVDQLTFCPPEFMEGIIPPQAKTIKGDVWSMGCVAMVWLIWLMDGMTGLQAFREACINRPSRATGDSPNRRFFIIESNKLGAARKLAGGSSTGDFDVTMRTDEGDQRFAMKLNPAIEAYIEGICGDTVSRPAREKTFVRGVVNALRKTALVPDPDRRGTMMEFCDELKWVLTEVRSDGPQTGSS